MVPPGVGEVMVAVTPLRVPLPSLFTATENDTSSPDSHSPLPLPPPLPLQTSVTVVLVVVVAWGPQATAGKSRVSVKLSIVPTSTLAWSTTFSVQVPDELVPSSTDSGDSGRKLPVKGAVPAEMAVVASSSKTVFV